MSTRTPRYSARRTRRIGYTSPSVAGYTGRPPTGGARASSTRRDPPPPCSPTSLRTSKTSSASTRAESGTRGRLSQDRLIILGIDALDWGYVERRRSELPTLASWPVVSPLASIFPPDSIPAWTTIFTGRGPGDHGYLDSIDYLDDDTPGKAAATAASALPHNTFWDVASERGMKVCVVNPFLAYPAWDVNGVMIAGPVFVDGTASITGIDPETLPPLPQLGGIVTFPTKKTVGPFVEETLTDTRAQADFGRAVLEQTDPDLFFMNILTVDRIKHFLWRYIDPEDPTYPGANPHEKAIDRMYDLVDEIVGQF